jgi:NTP pyrophosphatase (non-canonical NTP hydrolase)
MDPKWGIIWQYASAMHRLNDMDNKADLMQRLMVVSIGLGRRFPDNNGPFEIMTRLFEECGELAEQVNHFEGTGVKREKHGEPDKAKLAKEVQDVLRSALQVAQHYGIELELEASIENSYQRLKSEGFIE